MKLQKHFTTIEQSKRLLELGVPADSADLCIIDYAMNKGIEILTEPYSEYVKGYENISVPCWSVGRLMEIVDKFSSNHIKFHTFNTEMSYIEQMIVDMEFAKDVYEVDYSNLEERL